VSRALAIVVLSLASGCGRCASDGGSESDDGRACAAACAALTGAGCDQPGLRPSDAAGCTSRCLTRRAELSGAGCEGPERAYLDCVSSARVACGALRSAADVAIERREGIDGCAAEHAAYRACAAPCEHPGTRHSAERAVSVGGRERRVSVETARAGCAECPALGSGAPPASACQSPKVCAERCCECGDRRVRFTARVCADGACAGEDTCALARAAGAEPCAAQPR
jgi:hypothetical protein